ncbi:MAG: beta-galactosidase [Kiritimatiellae bacterium]|nr:beta-galactosidase [Kiritimatiellia bacterium]
MKALISAVVCAVTAMAGAAGDVVLWPSERATLRAKWNTRVAMLPDGAMGVETDAVYGYPGVLVEFPSGECDLSAYGRIAIAVSNTTDKAMDVRLYMKDGNTNVTRRIQSLGDSIPLAPHASGEMFVNLQAPWALDAPLGLNGMRGYPNAPGHGAAFDLRHVKHLDINLHSNGEVGGFSVRRVTVSVDGPKPKVFRAETFLPFVDRYGQFAHDDWPGKIHNDRELTVARTAEESWLEDHSKSPIPDVDRYGGWAGGPKLNATGFFRTEKVNGKWWLVDPEGHLFFSHGVTCVEVGAPTGVSFRENYFAWLPNRGDPDFGGLWSKRRGRFYGGPAQFPYDYDVYDFACANAVRKYGTDWMKVCAERAHLRIRAWGLNTIGNWSSSAVYGLRKTPYTQRFTTGGLKVGDVFDPFSPEFAVNAKRRAEAEAKRTGGDPWCIGWFVDNEIPWGCDDFEIGRAVLRSTAGQPAKKAAREMLERKYGTADRLDAAWGTCYGTWDGFLSATNVPDEKLCGPDLKDIHRAVAARYFRTVRDAIKAVAPNRLYLGARMSLDGGSDVIYEESARYCDVVSANVYSCLADVRGLPPEAADKPIISGEFHFGALDRGLFHPGLVAVRDQKERARRYRDYVGSCLDHPCYVGAHWFQWQDQALTGRLDSENYQVGFLNVADVPYPELVQAARDMAATMYRRRYGGRIMP